MSATITVGGYTYNSQTHSITGSGTVEDLKKIKQEADAYEQSAFSSGDQTQDYSYKVDADCQNLMGSAGVGPPPATKDNDGPLFSQLKDDVLAKKLEEKYGVKGGKWTQEQQNQCETYLASMTKDPSGNISQADKDGIKKANGIPVAAPPAKPADPVKPDDPPPVKPDDPPPVKPDDPPPPVKKPDTPPAYDYTQDVSVTNRLADSDLFTNLGDQYGMKGKLVEKLKGAKTTQEANDIVNQFKEYDDDDSGGLDGFHSEQDDDGNMLVDKGSEADTFLKSLGITPSYVEDAGDFAT